MDQQHNRNADRMRTMRQGQIVWDNAQRAINCKVRDFSKSGARLELTAPTALPDNFELRMPPAKELRPVQVMRRSGNVLGVMYLDAAFDSASEGVPNSGVAKYDPSLGDNPLFGAMPGTVRSMLPWASVGA